MAMCSRTFDGWNGVAVAVDGFIPIISKVLSLQPQFCELNLESGNEDMGIWFSIEPPTEKEGATPPLRIMENHHSSEFF